MKRPGGRVADLEAEKAKPLGRVHRIISVNIAVSEILAGLAK